MKQAHIELVVNRLLAEDSVYLSYLDPDPSDPTGVGGGKIRAVFGSSPGKVFYCSLSTSAAEAHATVKSLFQAACQICSLIFVEDLHHLLLRMGEEPCEVPDPSLDGSALVIDMSYVRSWGGHDLDTSVWDLARKLGKDVIDGCGHLFEALTKRARSHYHRSYLWILQEYVRHELQPVQFWNDECGEYTDRWIQFGMHDTRTGRLLARGRADLSGRSFNPHFLRRDLRASFVRARPGHMILSMDCKAAEIALGACLSGDAVLLDMLRCDGDPYMAICDRLPGGPHDRKRMKQLMIAGFAYGASVDRLVDETGWDYDFVREALRCVERTYPTFYSWTHQLVGLARDDGYVKTPTGRVIYVDEARARSLAPNYLFQSTNADVNTATFASILKACREERPHIKPMIHIHDGYVLEVPIASADADQDFLIEVATRVPLAIRELQPLVIKVTCERSDCWR